MNEIFDEADRKNDYLEFELRNGGAVVAVYVRTADRKWLGNKIVPGVPRALLRDAVKLTAEELIDGIDRAMVFDADE